MDFEDSHSAVPCPDSWSHRDLGRRATWDTTGRRYRDGSDVSTLSASGKSTTSGRRLAPV